jgi:hypothetical protein
MQTTESTVQRPDTATMSDEDLFDEMRAQVTWARNSNPEYSLEYCRAVMLELQKRKLLDLSAHADRLAD